MWSKHCSVFYSHILLNFKCVHVQNIHSVFNFSNALWKKFIIFFNSIDSSFIFVMFTIFKRSLQRIELVSRDFYVKLEKCSLIQSQWKADRKSDETGVDKIALDAWWMHFTIDKELIYSDLTNMNWVCLLLWQITIMF